MDEQSEGSRQILEATSQMNRITAQVKDGSLEILDGSRSFDQEMEKLLAASHQVRNKTSDLMDKNRSLAESVTGVDRKGC